LKKLGQQVTVVELFPRLLPRQLDNDGSIILKNHIASRGIDIVLGTKTVEVLGKNTVSGILLDNGETIHGDVLLLFASTRSNIELAWKTGIKVNRGVVVDEHLLTSVENVYTIGDVTGFKGTTYHIIPVAIEQARIAAANILGNDNNVYTGTIPSNTLNVVDVELTSIGLINPQDPKYEEIKETDRKKRRLQKTRLKQRKNRGSNTPRCQKSGHLTKEADCSRNRHNQTQKN